MFQVVLQLKTAKKSHDTERYIVLTRGKTTLDIYPIESAKSSSNPTDARHTR